MSLPIRPDIGAAFAAGRAGEPTHDIRQPNVIVLAVSVEARPVRAMIVTAIEQDPSTRAERIPAKVISLMGHKRQLLACAVQRRRFPVGASPTRQPLQPEAIGAVMEVTKWLKPSISASRIGDGASVQAATRVNAEQSSKRTMRRSTRQPYRGRLIRLDEMSEAIRSGAAPG